MVYSLHKLSSTVALSCVLFSLPLQLIAVELIKSIDQDGNVTYSDKPVPGSKRVTTIPLIPFPTENEVSEARLQADKNIEAANKIEQENKADLKKQKSKKKRSSVKIQKEIKAGPKTNYRHDPYYWPKPHLPIRHNLPGFQAPPSKVPNVDPPSGINPK